MLTLQGTITQIKARIAVSDDIINTLTLECHGDFSALHSLLKKPLTISIEELK